MRTLCSILSIFLETNYFEIKSLFKKIICETLFQVRANIGWQIGLGSVFIELSV